MDLNAFFTENPSGALAFSGGTDSSLLVWAAARWGKDWHAYYVHSAFQPAFELEDAKKIAARCGLPLTVLEADVLSRPEVAANPPDRCYHCKRAVFSLILERAAADGYSLLIDGTNASDDAGDRPGMRALRELCVRSPLRECRLTKQNVRSLSRDAGLFTWDKPSYACLATRIPSGTAITDDALRRIEAGENLLFAMGYRDFRIRLRGGTAVLQLPQEQQMRALADRAALLRELSPLFPLVALDLKSRN